MAGTALRFSTNIDQVSAKDRIIERHLGHLQPVMVLIDIGFGGFTIT